jgi:hypothetical protein
MRFDTLQKSALETRHISANSLLVSNFMSKESIIYEAPTRNLGYFALSLFNEDSGLERIRSCYIPDYSTIPSGKELIASLTLEALQEEKWFRAVGGTTDHHEFLKGYYLTRLADAGAEDSSGDAASWAYMLATHVGQSYFTLEVREVPGAGCHAPDNFSPIPARDLEEACANIGALMAAAAAAQGLLAQATSSALAPE